jgi:hypothetical protein
VVLDGVYEVETEYGPGYRWVFRVKDGPHAGCVFERTTGQQMIGGTALGDLMDAMYGRTLAEGDDVDPLAHFLGKEFELVAKPGKNSGGVFHKISPVVEAK